jgi:predicted anti-sigma-YlaC factor YlaD
MFWQRNDGARKACRRVREHLSAAIDGEVSDEMPGALARHLRDCADCRRFEQGAMAVSRHLRISVLEPVPDLTGPILESIAALSQVTAEVRDPHRRGVRAAPRLARWAVAVVPLGLAVSSLASGAIATPHVVPSHPPTRCTVALVHHHERLPVP